MKKGFGSLVILALLSAFTLSAFQPVFAQGPFEVRCPNCSGTGKVSEVNTCSICHGSGQTTVWQTCTTCYGSGKIEPTITLKSRSGWLALSGLDWVARVQGVFHNEEDRGTYGVATSKVNTVTETYYHSSPRTYFPPHSDVTITIDTSEISLLTDWTYSIYLSSKDDITCTACDGTKGKNVVATCSQCSGSGQVNSILTCPTCKGQGYITNQSAVNLAILAVAVVVIGGVLGTAFALSRRRRQVPPKMT